MKNTILNAITVILLVALFALGYAVIACEPNPNLYIALLFDIVGIAVCFQLNNT